MNKENMHMLSHYGLTNDSEIKEQYLNGFACYSEEKQNELLLTLGQYFDFEHQLFGDYLSPDQIDMLNYIVERSGGLQNASELYNYEYVSVGKDGMGFIGKDSEYAYTQWVINMIHVMNSKEKFDDTYRAAKGLPPLHKQLSFAEVRDQIREAGNRVDPYVGLDGQQRYIDGMDDDSFIDEYEENYTVNDISDTEETQTESVEEEDDYEYIREDDVGYEFYDQLRRENIQLNEAKEAERAKYGDDTFNQFDMDSIIHPDVFVEGMEKDPKPMAKQPQMQTEHLWQIQSDIARKNPEFSMMLSQESILREKTRQGDQMARMLLNYHNPAQPYYDYIAKTGKKTETVESKEVSVEAVQAEEQSEFTVPFPEGLVQESMPNTEAPVLPDATSLIMSYDEEHAVEKEYGFSYEKMMNASPMPTFDEAMALADRVAHPNQGKQSPFVFTAVNPVYANTYGSGYMGPDGIVTGRTPDGNYFTRPMSMPDKHRAQLEREKYALSHNGMVPPGMREAMKEDAKSGYHPIDIGPVTDGMDQIMALAHPGKTPEQIADKIRRGRESRERFNDIFVQNPGLADRMLDHIHKTSDGGEEFRLSSLTSPTPNKKAEAEQLVHMQNQGSYMRTNMPPLPPEPPSSAFISELRKSGFKEQVEELAKHKPPDMTAEREQQEYKSPLRVAMERSHPGSVYGSNMFGTLGYCPGVVNPVYYEGDPFPHIPENIDTLTIPPSIPLTASTGSILMPTFEEIFEGYSPLVAVSDKNGENPIPELFEARAKHLKAIADAKEKPNFCKPGETPKVAVILNSDTEEQIKEKLSSFMDYKQAAVIAKMDKELEIDYKFANELARYNQTLADEFLWYKNNGSHDEYIEIRREAADQLQKYRNADPLAAAKDTFVIMGDTLQISGPIHEYTMEELERKAEECRKKAYDNSQQGKEAKIIANYQKQADIINEAARKDIGMDNDEKVSSIMRKIQSLRNIQVISYGEDKAHQLVFDKKDMLPPRELEAHNQYMIWKKLKRSSWQGNPEEYDTEFDKWWFGESKINSMDQKIRKWKEYRNIIGAMLTANMDTLDRIRPTWDECVQKCREDTIKAWRQFDEGYIRDDMSLGEYLDAWGFLETRCLEIRAAEQRDQMTNLYDGNHYMNLIHKYSAMDSNKYGDNYTFCDNQEYNEKRQRFINSVFHSKERGTIAGGVK